MLLCEKEREIEIETEKGKNVFLPPILCSENFEEDKRNQQNGY